MHVAAEAEAPVLLVGDIDRGGVFAHLAGTMELLAPADRARVAGFLINKFRGDPALLALGLEFLRARFQHSRARRDSVRRAPAYRRRRFRGAGGSPQPARNQQSGQIDIAVVRLPRISNYDDFLALEHEDGVTVRFVEEAGELGGADLAIIPGSKSTVADLGWLNRERVRASDRRARARGRSGCGNLRRMPDAGRANRGSASGRVGRDFGARPRPAADSHALRKDQAHRASARARRDSFDFRRRGWHGGRDFRLRNSHGERRTRRWNRGAVSDRRRATARRVDMLDGAINRDGTVVGTMLHGIFENDALRAALLGALRRRKGLAARERNAAGRLARGGIRSPGRCGRGKYRSADAPKDSRARLIGACGPPRHPRREILELPP